MQGDAGNVTLHAMMPARRWIQLRPPGRGAGMGRIDALGLFNGKLGNGIFGQDEQDGGPRMDGNDYWWHEAFDIDNREFVRVLTPHPQSRTRSLPLARP